MGLSNPPIPATDPPPPFVVIGYTQGTNIPINAVSTTVQPPSANPSQQWAITYSGFTWQAGDLQYRAFRSFVDSTPGLSATYIPLN